MITKQDKKRKSKEKKFENQSQLVSISLHKYNIINYKITSFKLKVLKFNYSLF